MTTDAPMPARVESLTLYYVACEACDWESEMLDDIREAITAADSHERGHLDAELLELRRP